MRKFINLKTTVILLFSIIILGACNSNDSFEIFISGRVLQENTTIDSTTTKSFTPYIEVLNIGKGKINQASVKQGSSSLLGSEIRENVWLFQSSSSTRILESLNGTYTATASDENNEIDVKELVFNFKNEDALGSFEINTFSFDGNRIHVKGEEVENAIYYGLEICVGEEKDGVYIFPNLNWTSYENTTTVLDFTKAFSVDSYNRGQQIRVAVVALYPKGYVYIISRSDFKTIEVGKSMFLEDEISEE